MQYSILQRYFQAGSGSASVLAHGFSDIHKQAVVDDYDKPEQCGGVMGYVAPPIKIYKGCLKVV